MPRIQRSALPRDLLRHIYSRVMARAISAEALEQVLYWVERNPTVPDGEWFKRFDEVTICGEDALIKTVLNPDQTAIGAEVE